jgi:hypothetical protein
MQLKRSRRFLWIGQLCLPVLLGLGAIGWTPTPAQACGQVAPGTADRVDRSFSFKNGLRLGTQESMVLKTFGQPTERFGSGYRCGDHQVSFVYAADTVVVLDRTSPMEPVNPVEPSPHREAASRVIVQFSTQNPELSLSSNIHVGDRLEQVIAVYGQPHAQHSQNGLTIISYQQGNEVLRFQLKDERIESLDLLLNNDDRLRRYRAKFASTKTSASVHSTIAP